MHTNFLPRTLRLAAATVSLVVCTPAHAILSNSFDFGVSKMIPDGTSVGIADTRSIATEIVSITALTVSIETSGGFNGDLYAYHSNGTDLAVLLNRSGRSASDPFGYADEGYQETFDDSAANGDIHLYQETIDPMFGPITGTWQPSARDIDPGLALDTTPRTATLSSFIGTNPNGNWTLYFADIESGGIATWDSWSMEITGVIPEPSMHWLPSFAILFRLVSDRSGRKHARHGAIPRLHSHN